MTWWEGPRWWASDAGPLVIVTIHQPEHMPWLGFFDKAIRADLLVLLDYVQYRKNYFQNRNKIRTKDGWTWVTLPVKQPLVAPLNEIRVELDPASMGRYINLVRENYQHAPFFADYFDEFRKIILSSRAKLVDINTELIRYMFGALGIRTPIIVGSDLHLPTVRGGTEVNLSICKHVGATTYLSGISGNDYLDSRLFEEQEVQIAFQEFRHPVYRQAHESFLPCMSGIDLLFNHGPQSLDILTGEGVERLDTVFD